MMPAKIRTLPISRICIQMLSDKYDIHFVKWRDCEMYECHINCAKSDVTTRCQPKFELDFVLV